MLDRRRRLEGRLEAYQERMLALMKLDDDVRWCSDAGNTPDIDGEADESVDDTPDLYPDGWFTPERERVRLPSALAPGEISRLSLEDMATSEVELRKGQVVDALSGLRLALGEKSLCFRTQVRNAGSQRTTNRAWTNVHKYDAIAKKWRRRYHQARSALERLPGTAEYLKTLLPITEEDMKVAGDITEENRFGQRSDTLPWFWRVGEPDGNGSARLQECACPFRHYVRAPR